MHVTTRYFVASLLAIGIGLHGAQTLFAQQTPQTSPDTQPLRVYSREVVVDINATDAKDNPVHGLTRDDFTVTEDGRPMTPRVFREHRSDQAQPSPSPSADPLPAPNTFTNVGPPESARPLVVLLIDSMDTPLADQPITQKEMVNFVDKLPSGTRTAIFSLSPTGQLSLLQGFTADQDLLRKAFKSRTLSPQIPLFEDFGQEASMPSITVQPGKNSREAMSADPSAEKFNPEMQCSRSASRAQYTLAAMSQIARYLSGVPGRKNLIWDTGFFPLRMRTRGSICYDFSQAMGSVEGALDRSHISVFPIDPRAMDALAKNNPDDRIVQMQKVEHLTMETIAGNTGGKAYYTTNDLTEAALQAVETGSNYYTITYTPANQVNDTRLRNISVTVSKPGVTLLYKKGYHALQPGTTLTGQAIEKATPFQSAMVPGNLLPTEILFHVTAAATPGTETNLPSGNKAAPKMKPPYRVVTLSYLIDIGNIQFNQAADSSYHGQFEFAVNVYDTGKGTLLNSSDMAGHPTLSADAYRSMLSGGARVQQQIAIPFKGDYTLRIGVHDLTSDRVGSIEIPASAISGTAH